MWRLPVFNQEMCRQQQKAGDVFVVNHWCLFGEPRRCFGHRFFNVGIHYERIEINCVVLFPVCCIAWQDTGAFLQRLIRTPLIHRWQPEHNVILLISGFSIVDRVWWKAERFGEPCLKFFNTWSKVFLCHNLLPFLGWFNYTPKIEKSQVRITNHEKSEPYFTHRTKKVNQKILKILIQGVWQQKVYSLFLTCGAGKVILNLEKVTPVSQYGDFFYKKGTCYAKGTYLW